MSTRLDDLQALRVDLQARMEVCESDQNYAVMGRLLADILKQIDEIQPASSGEGEESPLAQVLRLAREGAAKSPRRSS